MSKPKGKNKWTELVECEICKKSLQRQSLRQHLQIHGESRFHCDICKVYKTTAKDALLVHKRLVHNIGQDSVNDCIFCKKKLNSYSALEKHLRSHIGERDFLCKFCSGEFLSIHNLTKHMDTHNSDTRVKTFCHVCKKGFSQKDNLRGHILRTHLRLHTGERPFKCKVCKKGFAQNVNLKTHYLAKHSHDKR